MAINTLTGQSYDPFRQQSGSVLGTSTPVAAGPVPTPVPPSGVNYTPQYSGSDIFTTQNPVAYTQTPAGQTALNAIKTSTGQTNTSPTNTNQQSYSDQALIDEYKRRGWTDMAAILASIKAGDYKNWEVSNTPNDRATIKNNNITSVAQNKGTDVALDYAQNYADTMSPDQYYAMIDQEAQNSNNFLNQQEASLRADQPGIEQGITNQANVLKNKAYNVKEDAQSAARRLYSELQQGYKQRFGGASSAGEAAMTLTNNEQQRQMAQNNRTYMDAVAQVDLSADQAIQSAQSEFRSALLEINKNRTAVESERLAARRQALSDLSQKVFAIQQQRETFKQNLALMQEQARLQNESNLKALSYNPTSSLTTTGNKATASGNQGLDTSVGYINPSGMSRQINVDEYMKNNQNPINGNMYQGILNVNRGYDQYGNPVYQ